MSGKIAYRTLALTWLFRTGQICGAATRAIPHENLKDEVVEKMTALASTPRIEAFRMPVGITMVE